MSADLTGVNSVGRLPGTPASTTRPIDPSRALVPVSPVTPRTPPTADSLLGRSGVGLGDVLLTADVLEHRDVVAPVALEMGLEDARASLLRQLPGDALAALDAVWSTARQSEEGWYLRSGALTVMGLPGEGDRIAAEGLQRQPASLALRLVQSVARMLVGDMPGARAALAPALDAAPHDPVLMAQQAVILARQGYAEDAVALLERLAASTPDHPALGWARGMLRTVAADRTRQAARRGTVTDPWRSPGRSAEGVDWPGTAALDDDDAAVDGRGVWGTEAFAPPSEGGDVAAAAFTRLGMRLRTSSDDELAREARLLLRAFSSGGTMCAAVSPEQAHAARSVLAGMLSLLSPAAASTAEHAPAAVLSLLTPLLAARRGVPTPPRGEEIARLLRRASGTVPATQHRLVDVLTRAASSSGRGAPGDAERSGGSGPYMAIVQGEPEPGSPVVPIRMGLALLTESRATRAADLARWPEDAPGSMTPWRGATPTVPGVVAQAEPSHTRYVSDWTTTRAIAEQQSTPSPGARGAGFVAVLCVTAALAAAINGATVIAVALGVGAAWFGLRRSARPRAD